MTFPYLISLNVQYPSGTSLASVNVACRIESTNEIATKTTNSSGDVTFNLGNTSDFPSGFSIGDSVSVYVMYSGYQQSFSFTIPSGSATVKDDSGVTIGSASAAQLSGNLVLVAVPTASTLRYFTAQDFLEFFDLKTKDVDAENGISLTRLSKIGESVESDIDSDCRRKFDTNSGSYHSSDTFPGEESPEYHDAKTDSSNLFFTKYKPIQAVSAVEVDQVAEGGTPDWKTLTATTDYNYDPLTGRITIIDSGMYPSKGKRKFRVTYTFGYTSVPSEIKMLSILETGMRMMGFNFVQNQIKDFMSEVKQDTRDLEEYRKKIIKKYKNHYFGS